MVSDLHVAQECDVTEKTLGFSVSVSKRECSDLEERNMFRLSSYVAPSTRSMAFLQTTSRQQLSKTVRATRFRKTVQVIFGVFWSR